MSKISITILLYILLILNLSSLIHETTNYENNIQNIITCDLPEKENY